MMADANVRGKFASKTDTIFLDVRAASDHQANVLRPAAIVGLLLIGDRAIVVAGPGGHRRHHDAVAHNQTWEERHRLK
jgi:hypothetical protein